MAVKGFVVPLVPDIRGGVRCKFFPYEKLPELLEDGYGFDGSSCGFCGIGLRSTHGQGRATSWEFNEYLERA